MKCQHQDITWAGFLSPMCQVSNQPFNGIMYDANIPGMGWANINQTVFSEMGCSLGTGKGQKYALRECGHWEKVAG
jgi:hypothetical protein